MIVQVERAADPNKPKVVFYDGKTDLDDLLPARCDKCGRTTIIRGYFVKTKTAMLCPRCYPKASSISLLWAYLLWIIGAVMWAALLGERHGGFAHHLVINTVLLIVVIHLSLVPHELIHALVAWLTRGEVYIIRLGVGPEVWSRQIGRLQFSVCRYLFLGYCVAGYTDSRWLRLRYGLFVAAPLLVHLALAVWLWPRFEWSRLLSSFAWTEVVALANAFLLIVNLFPWGSAGTGLTTDGVKLVSVLTGKFSADEILALSFAMKAASYFMVENQDEGLRVAEEGHLRFPKHSFTQSNWLGLNLLAERYEKVLPILAENVYGEYQEPAVQALDLNNLAWTIVCLHRAGKLPQQSHTLEQALAYARWAYAVLPWIPECEGTYGALLLETGETDKAVWHLLSAAKEQTDPKSRASNLALAAIGYHRLGKETQAQQMLAEATQQAPFSQQIGWAREELGMSPI